MLKTKKEKKNYTLKTWTKNWKLKTKNWNINTQIQRKVESFKLKTKI